MKQRQRTAKDTVPRRAVIFDFDGTIADSFEYVFDFLVKEAKNTTQFTAADRRALRKMSMSRLALHLGVPFWRLPFTGFKGRRVMRAHMEHVQPFPGMVEVVRALYADGWLLFIASSNSARNVRSMLRRCEIAECFTAVRGGAGLIGRFSKSAIIRRLMLRYRLRKSTTWYVGDELGDVAVANAVGLPCVMVSWGFADPDKLRVLPLAGFAERVSDIPRILEGSSGK